MQSFKFIIMSINLGFIACSNDDNLQSHRTQIEEKEQLSQTEEGQKITDESEGIPGYLTSLESISVTREVVNGDEFIIISAPENTVVGERSNLRVVFYRMGDESQWQLTKAAPKSYVLTAEILGSTEINDNGGFKFDVNRHQRNDPIVFALQRSHDEELSHQFVIEDSSQLHSAFIDVTNKELRVNPLNFQNIENGTFSEEAILFQNYENCLAEKMHETSKLKIFNHAESKLSLGGNKGFSESDVAKVKDWMAECRALIIKQQEP